MTADLSEPGLGKRFAFGKNWQAYLTTVGEVQIAQAIGSIRLALGVDDLKGRTFLDVGSGSGLFSLAAARLNAQRVHSFDIDADSVACTRALKARFLPHAQQWTIEGGDITDPSYVEGLGTWDVVYSWGLLHHTGNMWTSLENVLHLTTHGGHLFISIYNDQGSLSRFWRGVKAFYNSARWARSVVLATFVPHFVARGLAGDLVRGRDPLSRYRAEAQFRGMSPIHDMVDWLGGYPFEVARPDEVFRFFRDRGCALEFLKTCGGSLGCNEFVFRKYDHVLLARPSH